MTHDQREIHRKKRVIEYAEKIAFNAHRIYVLLAHRVGQAV